MINVYEGMAGYTPEYVQIGEFTLVCTCGACPEQYDAFLDGKQVGYFRLRHGKFYVDSPDVGGYTVYKAYPKGDGIFYEEEREYYLTEACNALRNYLNRGEPR